MKYYKNKLQNNKDKNKKKHYKQLKCKVINILIIKINNNIFFQEKCKEKIKKYVNSNYNI